MAHKGSSFQHKGWDLATTGKGGASSATVLCLPGAGVRGLVELGALLPL